MLIALIITLVIILFILFGIIILILKQKRTPIVPNNNDQKLLEALSQQTKINIEPIQELLSVFNHQTKIGQLGEITLGRILTNASNNLNFKTQYQMKNIINKEPVIVDCFIFGNEHYYNLPIDSKFPYQTYLQINNINNESNVKDFINAVKNHVKTIAKKYVSPNDNTLFAIMYLPSEAIYHYLQDEHNQIIEFAFSQNVIIASPSILFPIIKALDFNNQKMDYQVNFTNKLTQIQLAANIITALDEDLINLKTTLTTLQKRLEKVEKNKQYLTSLLTTLKPETKDETTY